MRVVILSGPSCPVGSNVLVFILLSAIKKNKKKNCIYLIRIGLLFFSFSFSRTTRIFVFFFFCNENRSFQEKKSNLFFLLINYKCIAFKRSHNFLLHLHFEKPKFPFFNFENKNPYTTMTILLKPIIIN